MSSPKADLILDQIRDNTVGVISPGIASARCALLFVFLFGIAIPAAATGDAGALIERLQEAETLIEQARGYLRDGRYADANAAARLANTIVQALPEDTAARLRALRIDPERHVRRAPPPFSSVARVRHPVPPGARGVSRRDADILTVVVSPTVIRTYDAQRNPWNGDYVYLYNETAVGSSNTGARLYAAIDLLRPLSEEPFDLRAMEIRVGSERYRFGFPDETVARTADAGWQLESVRIPIDAALRPELEQALPVPSITIILEGNEERVPLVIGQSERDAILRMLSWSGTVSEPD